MNNFFLLVAFFCLTADIDCSMAVIKLDKESEARLLEYAWIHALDKNLWPLDAVVRVELFGPVNQDVSSKDTEFEYVAKFYARFDRRITYQGQLKMVSICNDPVIAKTSAAMLTKYNIVIPGMR